MAAPTARPPITPAAMPQPRQRASAVVGAATDAMATAPPAATTVKNLVMDVSQVLGMDVSRILAQQRHTADTSSTSDRGPGSSAREQTNSQPTDGGAGSARPCGAQLPSHGLARDGVAA